MAVDESTSLDPEEYLRQEMEVWRLRFSAPAWLRDNPGLAITGLYVGASSIGMAYLFHFFRRFGINVLEFADPADFLMVVVREPATIALALMGIPVYALYMGLTLRSSAWMYRRWPSMRRQGARVNKYREMQRKLAPLLQIVFIITYAGLFMVLYSAWQASRVRAGNYPKVTVEYKTDALGGQGAQTFTHLGTTSRFLFIYRADTRRGEAIPFDSIARLSWDARPRREREASPQAQ